MPLFSVVVPVFNRDPSECLRSVRAQTFSDFECLVVDDGSANGAEIEAAVEAMNDARFRYIRQENGGGGSARNAGIEAAFGRFIAFLDSDDEWLPAKLGQDSQHARDGVVLFSQVRMVRNGREGELRPPRGPRPGEDISEYLILRGGWTQTSTLVVPASATSRFSTYNRFGQDTDIALKLAAEGLAFEMLPQSLVFVDDTERAGRVSRSDDWTRAAVWLYSVRDLMTERAFRAYKGWHVARIAAQSGKRWVGFRLYLQGVQAMPPRLAVKAMVQILVPRRVYRLSLTGNRPTERLTCPCPPASSIESA
jgi:glycosyltransferase involved in cell wall biosynthesis